MKYRLIVVTNQAIASEESLEWVLERMRRAHWTEEHLEKIRQGETVVIEDEVPERGVRVCSVVSLKPDEIQKGIPG